MSESPVATVPSMMAAGIRVSTSVTGVSGPRQIATSPTSAAAAATPPPAATRESAALQDATITAVTPLTAALATTTTQVTQAADTVVAPATAAAGVQSLAVPVADLASSVTPPIPDVLTSIQALLTSTTDAIVPGTQQLPDLATLLGITGVPSVTEPVGASAPWPTTATLLMPLQTAKLLATGLGSAGTDDAGQAARTTTTSVAGATSAIAAATSLNANARIAPGNAMSEGLQAFVHSYGALVIAGSLSVLFAAALPGLIALLVPTAAGVGVGYRQANAGIALRSSGIARFAGSGPVGIVRTGSLVSIGPSGIARRAAYHASRRVQRFPPGRLTPGAGAPVGSFTLLDERAVAPG